MWNKKRTSAAFMLLCAAAFITGCAVPNYNYEAASVEISEPPLDSVATSYIGDVLVRQGHYSEHDAILIKEDTQIGLLGGYTLVRGHYLKQGDDADTEFYLPAGKDGSQIVRRGFSDPPQIVQAYKTANKICVVSIYQGAMCKEGAQFTRTKQQVESADSFQQALIYSGRVGNRVKIGYREYSSSLARPAFNNEAEYDLNESKIIGYKNARIEILEATNESIRYRVLKNFNTRATSRP